MRKFPTSLVRENKWAAADCGFCWSVRLQQMFMVRKNYPLGTHNGLLLLQFLGIRVHFFHTELSMILEIENYDRQPLIFPLGYFVRTTDLHKIGVAYVPLLLRCLKAKEKHDENVSFCGKLQIHLFCNPYRCWIFKLLLYGFNFLKHKILKATPILWRSSAGTKSPSGPIRGSEDSFYSKNVCFDFRVVMMEKKALNLSHTLWSMDMILSPTYCWKGLLFMSLHLYTMIGRRML